MKQYQARQSAIINAPADLLYGIIADYHDGHRAMLPARYFTDMTVTQGGFGAGTTVTVRMNVFGARSTFEMVVTEPVPSKKLVGSDQAAGVVTTFDLEPVSGDRQTRVTITTKTKIGPGLRGFVERFLNPPIMRRIYRKELEQLAQIAQTKIRQVVQSP